MAELGKLFYSLGLKTDGFKSDIEAVERLVNKLNVPKNIDTKLSIDKEEIKTALQSANALKTALDNLKDKVTITISGAAKTVSLSGIIHASDIKVDGTKDVNLSGNLINDAQLKSMLEQKLRGITIYDVNVDPTNIKNALKQQMWNIQVTSDASSVGKIVKQIQSFLGINKISVNVNPNLGKKDLARLKKDVEDALKGVSVPVRFTKTDIQKQLDKLGKFYVDADVRLHTNTLQSQLNQVRGQITLNGSNVGGSSGSNNGNYLGNAIQQQRKLNQHATDELGIRRAINDQMRTNTMIATIFGNTLGNVFATYQIQRFLEGIIQVGGEIQKQRLALGHIIDNVANANYLFEQMKQLAVKSPFGLLDLMQNARQLSAFGVEYNNLYDTMKRLSDMAAGLGIQFSRIALAYGETKERGFLDGKLVRQFSYMGLPVLQKIAEYYTQIDKLGNGAVVTASKVRSMVSDKQVSFEDVDAVIQKMTEYGGQFYNMQDVMAESVSGKWKNLKDAIDIMYNDIVEGNNALFKAPAEILTKLTRNYDALLAVLAAVGVRLVGNKAKIAANNTILATNSALLYQNKEAQQQNLIAAIKRNGLYKSLNATEKQRLATIKAMSLGEFEQIIRTQQLTKNDVERLIMMKQLSNEQIQYLVRLKLISQAEVDAALKATKFTMAMRGLKASIASLFSGANLWMLGLTAIFEAWTYFSNKAEKESRFIKDVSQSAEDFRKATASIQAEVINLNFDNMSVGERDAEIKAMVEYIKDNAPDAGRRLNDIFKTDKNGNFVNTLKDRFVLLQQWVGELETLSKLDLSESEKSIRNIFNAWDVDSAAEKFIKTNSETTNMLNNTIFDKRSQSDILNDVKEFKRKYKAAIMEALNITTDAEFKGIGLRDIQKLALSNNSWMQTFINTFDISSAHIKNWRDQYVNTITSMSSAAHNAFQEMKRQNAGTVIDITTPNGRNIWDRIVDVTVMTEYKDKPSEVQQMIRRFMQDPTIMAQLQVSTDDSREFVKQMLNNPDVYKKVYLDILPRYDGQLTTDPWDDIMNGVTGSFDTKDTAAGNYDNILKDAKNGYAALQKSKKMTKLYNQVTREVYRDSENYEQVLYKAAEGVNKADQELIDAFAGNITQAENKLLAAKKAALKTGLDWDKIYADAVKAFNQKDNGKQNKEDALLNSLKTQFDEIKKTYNEYEKWAKAVGRKKAGEKMISLGLIDSATANELASPDYYKNKILEMQKKYEEELKKTEQRKKFNTSLSIEVGEIELKGINEAMQRAQDKAYKEINDAAKEYDLWKTWYKATGDSDKSAKMAINIVPVWDEKSKALLKSLQEDMQDTSFNVTMNSSMWDRNVLQSRMKTDMKDSGISEATYAKYKEIYDSIWNAGVEFNKNMALAAEKAMPLVEKINALKAQKEYQLNLYVNSGQGQLGDKGYQDLANHWDEQIRDMQKQLLAFEPIYKKVFEDTTNKSIGQLKVMRDAQKRILDAVNDKNTLITEKDGKLVYQFKLQVGGVKKEFVLTGDEVERMRKNMEKLSKKTKGITDSFKVLRGWFKGSTTEDIDGNTKKLYHFTDGVKALAEVLTELNNMSDGTLNMLESVGAIGKKDGSTWADALLINLKGVADIATKIANEDYTGAFTSAMNLASQDVGIFTQKFLNEVAELERKISDIKSEYQALESEINRQLGSVTKTQSNKLKSSLQSQYDELKNLYNKIEETNKLDDSDKQSKLAEIKEQIREVKEELDYFYEDLANKQYGIDIKGWANEIASNLRKAFQEGSNAASAFDQSVQSIMESVVDNVLSLSVIQPAMEKLRKYLFGENGILTDSSEGGTDMTKTEAGGLAVELASLKSSIANAKSTYDAIREAALVGAGIDLSGNSSSSSLGNSITSISEEEGNILASYMAAMRIDLSAQRMNFETFMDEYIGRGDETLSNIASSQLRELVKQTEYLHIIAEKIVGCEEHMNDLQEGMHRVTSGYESMTIG